MALAAAGCGGSGGSTPPAPLVPTASSGLRVRVEAEGARGPLPLSVASTGGSAPAGGGLDAPHEFTLNPGGELTLTAPEGVADRAFAGWRRDGRAQADAGATVRVSAVGGNGGLPVSLTAVFVPRAPSPQGFLPNFAGETNPQNGRPNRLFRWGAMPVRVFFRRDGTWTAERQRQALAGFDLWPRATGGVLAYEVTGDVRAAQVTVRFADEGETGYHATTTLYPDEATGIIRRGEVTVNTSYAVQPVANVAAHEMGHALGIDGHSNSREDVMHPAGSGEARLSARDINTLASAYPDRFGGGRSAPPSRAAASGCGGAVAIRCQ